MFWSFAALIIFCAVYFHSKTDPGTRFAIRNGQLANYGPSWWDQQKFGSFTPGDLAVFAFAYAGFIERLRTGRLHVAGRTAWLIGLGTTAVLAGIAAGVYHETASPFGDWRDLAVGLLFAFALWSTVLQTDRDCLQFAQIFVAIMAAYGVDQLDAIRLGRRRDRLLRPDDDGRPRDPGVHGGRGRHLAGDAANEQDAVALVGGDLVGTSVVALAFRRYAWVELAIVFAAFVLLLSGASRRRYLVAIGGVAAACLITVALTWSSLDWSGRLNSLDPTLTRDRTSTRRRIRATSTTSSTAGTRSAHTRCSGSGWASSTSAQRTAQWKGDAGMVHNAPIEVWIKFGLLGLVVFVAIYVILFRDIWRRRNRGRILRPARVRRRRVPARELRRHRQRVLVAVRRVGEGASSSSR